MIARAANVVECVVLFSMWYIRGDRVYVVFKEEKEVDPIFMFLLYWKVSIIFIARDRLYIYRYNVHVIL